MKQPLLSPQPHMVEWQAPQMVRKDAPTFGGKLERFVSGGDVLSAEEAGIHGPGSRSDHRNRATEGSQRDRNPRITGIGQSDPHFDDGDNGSCDWGPHPSK